MAAVMVDVSESPSLHGRLWPAACHCECGSLCRCSGRCRGGEVLKRGRIAGIMAGPSAPSELICAIAAAEQAPGWIFTFCRTAGRRTVCTARTISVTSVEIGSSDRRFCPRFPPSTMCKAVDKGMELGEIAVEKTGGKSRHYVRAEAAMFDAYGRNIHYLRLSVTATCATCAAASTVCRTACQAGPKIF